MRLIVIGAIPLVAVLVLRQRGTLSAKKAHLRFRRCRPLSFLIGLVIGFYDGLLGPAQAPFMILLFTMIMGKDAVAACRNGKNHQSVQQCCRTGDADAGRPCAVFWASRRFLQPWRVGIWLPG